MIPLGDDFGKLAPGFLQILPHVTFPFADFSLYTFAVINHSSEINHLLNPVSPPSKSNLERILQTPTEISYLTFVIQTGLKQLTQIQQPYFSLF